MTVRAMYGLNAYNFTVRLCTSTHGIIIEISVFGATTLYFIQFIRPNMLQMSKGMSCDGFSSEGIGEIGPCLCPKVKDEFTASDGSKHHERQISTCLQGVSLSIIVVCE